MTFYRYAAAAGLLCSATSISAQGVSTDCLSQIYGQECGERLNTITTAVPFLMIGPDSRSGGMGDAGVALPADANAIHWNPSKLAFAENKSEIKISISPWLRNLVPDMSLAYVAAYSKLKNKRSAIGGSLRYFNLGSILRYINSNLTGGLNVSGANTKAGQSVAADVSFLYQKPQLELGDIDGIFAFGVNISNMGAKMSYSDAARRDFIPINLRLGPCLTMDFDKFNRLSINVDVNKLLVPTPPIAKTKPRAIPVPIYNATGDTILSGEDPTRGVAAGIIGSFSDAPGDLTTDYEVLKGSKLREELREINFGGGFEYWYARQFAFRAGYFYEHRTKGNRQYITMGLGVRYSIFSLDFSYLIANTQRSPLANTLRFTLGFNFDGKAKKKKDEDVE